MKKILLVLAMFAAAACSAATLFTQKDPQPGGQIAIRNPGRLSSIDVFSTEATGTVNLSRVFSATVYTNAYDVSEYVVTNVVDVDVLATNYVDRVGNVLHEIPVDPGQSYFVRDWSNEFARVYWVMWADAAKTIPQKLRLEIPDQPMVVVNVKDRRDCLSPDFRYAGAAYSNCVFETRIDVVSTYVATNVATVVVTNSVTKLKKHDLTVTNAIFSASCTNNCFHGSPSPDVWIFPNDKILFNGTATGGELRMVIE